MSQKLPIGDVLNETVQFGLHHWVTVLRFAWVPFVLSALAFIAYFAVVFDPSIFSAAETEADFGGLKESLRAPAPVAIALGVALYLVVIFLFCGVMASLFRLAALGEHRPGLVQLRLDGPALRVFLAYLVIIILNFAIWGAAFALSLSLSGQSWATLAAECKHFIELAAALETGEATDMQALQTLMALFKAFSMAGLLAAVPLIYVNLKLAPFPAGSASENRLVLFGAFAMTFGHFWSMLGIYILFIIFLIAIGIAFQLAVWTFQLIAAVALAQGGGLAIVAGVTGVAILAASIVFQLFCGAMQTALPAIIYRRLKTGE